MNRAESVRWRIRRVTTAVRRRPARAFARVAILFALGVAASFFVAPLYWLLAAALEPPGSIAYPPSLVPAGLSVAHLVALATETAFVRTYLLNSLLVSVGTVVTTVAVATPAGYALSTFQLRFERLLLASLLGLQLVPLLSVVVPLYRAFAILGLIDSLVMLVLVETALAVPVAVFLIKGYYDSIPPGLEEAARVGGATRFEAFRVVAPLGRPAIGAAAIYAFVLSWNQFVLPLTFAPSRTHWTYPVGLYEFVSRHGVVDWGLLGAASLLAVVPVFVVFAVFQRHLVAGILGEGLGGGQ